MEGSYITEKRELYSSVEGNSVPATYATGDSSTGGYIEGVIRIDWSTSGYDYDTHTGGGISGISWYTGNMNSPFYGLTGEQLDDVVTYANAHNELDSYFSTWGSRTDISGEERSDFATMAIRNGCGAVIME